MHHRGSLLHFWGKLRVLSSSDRRRRKGSTFEFSFIVGNCVGGSFIIISSPDCLTAVLLLISLTKFELSKILHLTDLSFLEPRLAGESQC